jgi:ketosteroid isomerase-like protein
VSIDPSQVVRRALDEVWTRAELDRVEELYADDFVGHVAPFADLVGRDAVRAGVEAAHAAFDRYTERVDALYVCGDLVTVRATVCGIQRTAACATFSSPSLLLYRVAEGLICEQWEIVNLAGISRQLETT